MPCYMPQSWHVVKPSTHLRHGMSHCARRKAVPPSLQAPHRTQKEGGNGGVPLGAAPDLHRVDLNRRIQLNSVLLTASNIEDPGGYKMA